MRTTRSTLFRRSAQPIQFAATFAFAGYKKYHGIKRSSGYFNCSNKPFNCFTADCGILSCKTVNAAGKAYCRPYYIDDNFADDVPQVYFAVPLSYRRGTANRYLCGERSLECFLLFVNRNFVHVPPYQLRRENGLDV